MIYFRKRCCVRFEILIEHTPSICPENLWLIKVDGVHLNLIKGDQRRLKGSLDNGWLNDTIMDASQSVLRQHFPNVQGMQSVLYAAKPEFQPVSGSFVQLVNTHPNDGGLHWICFSNFNCNDGVVSLYDSAGGTYISSATANYLLLRTSYGSNYGP